jgi:hypothetical protein
MPSWWSPWSGGRAGRGRWDDGGTLTRDRDLASDRFWPPGTPYLDRGAARRRGWRAVRGRRARPWAPAGRRGCVGGSELACGGGPGLVCPAIASGIQPVTCCGCPTATPAWPLGSLPDVPVGPSLRGGRGRIIRGRDEARRSWATPARRTRAAGLVSPSSTTPISSASAVWPWRGSTSLLPPSPSLSPPSSRSTRRWSRPARACWRPWPPHMSARATWIRPVGSALTLSSSPSASR